MMIRWERRLGRMRRLGRRKASGVSPRAFGRIRLWPRSRCGVGVVLVRCVLVAYGSGASIHEGRFGFGLS